MSNRKQRRIARGQREWPLLKATYPRTDADGLHSIRVGSLTESAGNARVAQGTATRLTSAAGHLVGFALCEPVACAAESSPSSRVISRSETERIAGSAWSRGGSRTRGLTEEQRVSRVYRGRYLPPEDAVELALVKQQAFLRSANYASGDRVVRVYPQG